MNDMYNIYGKSDMNNTNDMYDTYNMTNTFERL